MEIEAETRQSPSVDAEELRHFEKLAAEWWNERGKFRALHAFNPARLTFIVEEIQAHCAVRDLGFRPLSGLRIIDIGCGGGILSEPLARLGAEVTGIDPVEDSIRAANAHAEKLGVTVSYRAATVEDIAREGGVFDAVIASEVIEHVADTGSFLRACRVICKQDGVLILSTLNRTAKSYALAIVAAEHLLGLVPRGTHDWKKFIKPEELEGMIEASNFGPLRKSGIVFRPLTGVWRLSAEDLGINYIVSAKAG
ncbi:MAG: bifunctional 2-polyprenyl-6-hydroxyphenol methylase/3-demethylubiquinol 3-O-methyltransferase UbiG [Rhodomicrobium sp.]